MVSCPRRPEAEPRITRAGRNHGQAPWAGHRSLACLGKGIRSISDFTILQRDSGVEMADGVEPLARRDGSHFNSRRRGTEQICPLTSPPRDSSVSNGPA